MNTLRDAAQQLLDAVESAHIIGGQAACDKAVAAVRAALAEQPAQRKPLTDEQILADKTLRYHFGLNCGAGPVSKKAEA